MRGCSTFSFIYMAREYPFSKTMGVIYLYMNDVERKQVAYLKLGTGVRQESF